MCGNLAHKLNQAYLTKMDQERIGHPKVKEYQVLVEEVPLDFFHSDHHNQQLIVSQ